MNKLANKNVAINNRAIGILFLIVAINTMGVGFVWPLFGPLFLSKTSTLFAKNVSMYWRDALYSIAIGVTPLFTFLCAPMIGAISDYIGRRKILLFCLFGTTVSMVISIFGIVFNQAALLILSRALLGIAAANQVIAQTIVIDLSNYTNKLRRLGLILTANNVGFILGPIIGGLLIDNTLVRWFSISTPFYVAAVFTIFGALLLCVFYKEKPPEINTAKILDVIRADKIFIRLFKHKNIRVPAFIYACLQAGWATFFQTVFFYLIKKYSCSSFLLGAFVSWMGCIFCFNLLVVTRIVTFTPPFKKYMLVILIVTIICSIATIYDNEIFIWLNIIPMASAVSLGSNIMLTTFSNAALNNEQGWSMGIGNSIRSLSWAITPLITSTLLMFDYHAPLLFSTILFLLAAFATFASKCCWLKTTIQNNTKQENRFAVEISK